MNNNDRRLKEKSWIPSTPRNHALIRPNLVRAPGRRYGRCDERLAEGVRRLAQLCLIAVFLALFASPLLAQDQADPLARRANANRGVIAMTQAKVVKINGAGGFRGLESYQTGCLISADGLILTAWSSVLDADTVRVTLNDGRKYEAKLAGYVPQIEIALLKIEDRDLAHFNLDKAKIAKPGQRIFALSNLFRVATGDEPVSVQRGVVSAITKLSARQGASRSVYQGDVLLIDAITNNPGASGGVIVDTQGQLLGMVGKELKDAELGTWINFALPIEVINPYVQKILNGEVIDSTATRKPTEPMTEKLLGLYLVPNVVNNTPPFIDRVIKGSLAEKAGLKPDDLVIKLNDRLTRSAKDFTDQLEFIDRDATIEITVRRDNQFLNFELQR